MTKNLKAYNLDNSKVIDSEYMIQCDLEAGTFGTNKEILAELWRDANGTLIQKVQFGKTGSVEAKSAAVDWTYPTSEKAFQSYIRSKSRKYTKVPRANLATPVVISKSKANDPVSMFLDHIFDEADNSIRQVLLGEFTDIHPDRIAEARDHLLTLSKSIKTNNRKEIIRSSSRYYSLIPHQTGSGHLQIPRHIHDALDVAVNSTQKLEDEYDFLQSIEDAVKAKAGFGNQGQTKQQDALGAEITLADSKTTKRIRDFIIGSEGRHFHLKVGNVFEINNPFLNTRYDRCDVHNPVELFHGSGNANSVGIISRGLLLRPQNVPLSGAMFGNGIYTADKSTKSAQYTFHRNAKRNPHYLFVCEVKLGNIKKLQHSDSSLQRAPAGYHSVQGEAGYSLAYNEFIVYNESQITLRYIAEITRS